MKACTIDTSHLPDAPGVYRIVNGATGDSYIGGSASIRGRCVGHALALVKGRHHSRLVRESFAASGPSAFAFEVLEICDTGEISARERVWIERLAPRLNVSKGECRVRKARPPQTSLTVPMSQELAERLNALARADERDRGSLIRLLIREAIEARESKARSAAKELAAK